ncbi:MAG: 50S ribosomal protein L9 [Candidatus Paceibacteria bacterium]
MKIILLKDVAKVGQKFDVKNVSDGYAMNFLFPNNLAEPATEKKIKSLETAKLQHEAEDKVHQDLLLKNLKALDGASVEMEGKANEKGHLFKGIHIEEIAEELKKQDHIDLKPEYIQLEHPIKEVGEFDVTAKVGDAKAVFKLVVSNIA